MKVFVPFTEALAEKYGCALGELVPFQLEYELCPIDLLPDDEVRTAHVAGNRQPSPRKLRQHANSEAA